MTHESTQPTIRSEGAAPAVEASAKPAPPARPGPWDAPWHGRKDSAGWETVYRGTGQQREITSSLVLELTAEQNDWIDRAAEAAGVTPHAVIKRLIDDARASNEVAAPGMREGAEEA